MLTEGRQKVTVIRPDPIDPTNLFTRSSHDSVSGRIESSLEKFTSELESMSGDDLKGTVSFILSLHEAVSLLGVESTDSFLRRLTALEMSTLCIDLSQTRLLSPQALVLFRRYGDVDITIEDKQSASLEARHYSSVEEEASCVLAVVAEASVVRRSRATGRVTEDSTFLALCRDSNQQPPLTILPLGKRVSGVSGGDEASTGAAVGISPLSSSASSANTSTSGPVTSSGGGSRVPIIVFDKSDQELETAEDDDDGTLDDDLDL